MNRKDLVGGVAACALSLVMFAGTAGAVETDTLGSASAPTRQEASELARLAAVKNQINSALGANTVEADDAVAAQVDKIREQVGDEFFHDAPPIPYKGQILVKTHLIMDDVKFRNILTELGLDKSSNASSLNILALVDEFDTTPADPNLPLVDIIEASTSKGSSYSDTSSAASFSKSASAKASKSASSSYEAGSMAQKASDSSSSRLNASGSQSASGSFSAANGYGDSASGSASGSSRGSLSASGSQSSSSQTAAGYVAASGSSSSSASMRTASSGSASKMNIHQEEHDNTSFKRTIIRADTTNVANGSNYSYNALGAILGSLRINPVEPSAFRSQYIGPKVDVAQIEKNPSFGSWIAAAKTKMNASDLLVGTTNIYQRGLNNMGQNKCSAVQAIRVFDTTTGKQIAFGQGRAEGVGQGAQECSQNAANALGEKVGAQVGRDIIQFYKNQATYGQAYTVALIGANITPDQQDSFLSTLKSIQGLKINQQQSVTSTLVQYTITYNGVGVQSEIRQQLKRDPSLAALQQEVVGDKINFCIGSCQPAASSTSKTTRKH